MITIDSQLEKYQTRIQHQLEAALPDTSDMPQQLHQAMRYAVLNGGKRIRPMLVYAVGESLDAQIELLDAAAIAVELIHAYSLVHDDLPAMDDDALRRGKLTCHKAFNEATAILVGDALQSLAFEVLSASPCHDQAKVKMLNILAKASGSYGMAGGQAIDLQASNHSMGIEQLRMMHRLKTGALINASVMLGAHAANCQDSITLSQLNKFGEHLGLAFQIQDDILDIESTTEQLGKPQGSDIAHNKTTYPAILGLKPAKQAFTEQCDLALACINNLSTDFKILAELLNHLVKRDH